MLRNLCVCYESGVQTAELMVDVLANLFLCVEAVARAEQRSVTGAAGTLAHANQHYCTLPAVPCVQLCALISIAAFLY